MLTIKIDRFLSFRRGDRTTVHSQGHFLSTKNFGNVNLTLGELVANGFANAKNFGPEMYGAAGVHDLQRQENSSVVKGFLPRRCTTVKPHSEPVLLFRHLPPFLSRDGE